MHYGATGASHVIPLLPELERFDHRYSRPARSASGSCSIRTPRPRSGDNRGIAIRFRLDPARSDRIVFAISPLFEAVQSLHVLVEPRHHPDQHPWVRAARRLPATLKREIRAFSFLYRHNLPNCFLPRGRGRQDFELELDGFRSLDERMLAYELTRPLHDHGGRPPYDPRLDDATVLTTVRERGREAGPEAALLVDRLVADPAWVGRRLAELLAAYWESGFAAEWGRIERPLARAAAEGRRLSARGGFYSLLRAVAPRLRIDPAQREFGLDLPHDHALEVGPEDELVLVPSVYVRPHVRVNCDRPWPLAVVYPASCVGSKRSPAPAELVEALRALGEGTRLHALRLIAERPRSPQELAPLIGISEAGLSKHLRRLAHAGLVRTHREGWYVVYSLVPARAAEIAQALHAYVGRDDA